MLTSPPSRPPTRMPRLKAVACGLLGIIACGVLAASPPVRPLPANAPPMCGSVPGHQVITLGVDGTAPGLEIMHVAWEFKVYCTDRSADHFYTHDTFLSVFQGPRVEFLQSPAEGFEGLALGRLLTHAENRTSVSITLADAQQGNWCIQGTVTFVGQPPHHFGPFTVRQAAGSSSSALAFLATRDTAGHISVMPTFGYMEGCVGGP